jgi:hypothetical protein
MIIAYSGCVFVALGIQLAKRMRRLILSSVACPALQYSDTSANEDNSFRDHIR